MSTTTIRLEDDLKARVAAAAERCGKSPHAFILEAIEQTVEASESEAEFRQLAETRWARLLETGKSVPLAEARAYLEARVAGTSAARPASRRPR